MLTKWAKIAMKYAFIEFGYDDATRGYVFPDAFTWADGITSPTEAFVRSYFPTTRWFDTNNSQYCRVDNGRNTGFYLGSGGTTPTDSDYFLEEPITSGIYWTSVNSWIDANPVTGNLRRNMTFIITNNLVSTPLTIREIGYIGEGTADRASDHWRHGKTFMIDRTVLDTAIIIQPNTSANLKYSFELDYTPSNP